MKETIGNANKSLKKYLISLSVRKPKLKPQWDTITTPLAKQLSRMEGFSPQAGVKEPHKLIVNMENDTATLENSAAFS